MNKYVINYSINNQRTYCWTISASSFPSSRGRKGEEKLPKLLQCRSLILHQVKASLWHNDIGVILVATCSAWRYESPIVISTLNTDINFNTASKSIYERQYADATSVESYFWADYSEYLENLVCVSLKSAIYSKIKSPECIRMIKIMFIFMWNKLIIYIYIVCLI